MAENADQIIHWKLSGYEDLGAPGMGIFDRGELTET
jgi:hypothetical protein